MIQLLIKLAKALALDFGEEFAPHAKSIAKSLGALMILAVKIELGDFTSEETKSLFIAELHALKGIVYEAEQTAGQSFPSVGEIIADLGKAAL